MDEKDFDTQTRIIKETFYDDRKIKCVTPEIDRQLPEHVYPGEDIFTTEDGEFIDLEFQMTDFDEDELVKYVEFAEEMYEKHKKHISVYIICPDYIKVLVRECPLKSDADFTIKLSCCNFNVAFSLLRHIKSKIRKEMALDEDDKTIIENLPVICRKEDRNFFRKESILLLNRYF